MSEHGELNAIPGEEIMSSDKTKSTEWSSADPGTGDESDNETIGKAKEKKTAAKRKGKPGEPKVEPIAKSEQEGSCICARGSYQIKCLKCKNCFVGRIFEKCAVHPKSEQLMDAEFCLYCGQESLIRRSDETDYSDSDGDEEFDDMDISSGEMESECDETDSESDGTLVDIVSSDSSEGQP